MFHTSRRRDFGAPGILEAPPAEKSVTPKCAETKLKLNRGQRVCNFEEKSLLKAHFLGSNGGIWGVHHIPRQQAREMELFTIREITTTLNPVRLGAIRWSVSGIATI